MKILLDECLPRKLRNLLVGHDCVTAPEMGWAGKRNGELLRLADGRFDVFLTSDRNLSFQQNLSGLSIAVVVPVAKSNRLASLAPLIPALFDGLSTIRPGAVVLVG